MVVPGRRPPPDGRPRRAIPCYHQARDLFRKFDDPYAEASTLAHVGACHHLAGDLEAAREQWRRAYALLGDLASTTVDQIHTQLTIIDTSAANAFRRHLKPSPEVDRRRVATGNS